MDVFVRSTRQNECDRGKRALYDLRTPITCRWALIYLFSTCWDTLVSGNVFRLTATAVLLWTNKWNLSNPPVCLSPPGHTVHNTVMQCFTSHTSSKHPQHCLHADYISQFGAKVIMCNDTYNIWEFSIYLLNKIQRFEQTFLLVV